MESYHYVWLQSHLNRSEQWLQERLIDGFSIHHIDGNHANNSPDNLVLIENQDHFHTIHVMPWKFMNRTKQKRAKKKTKSIKLAKSSIKSDYEFIETSAGLICRPL